jgi:hypothetical protein
MKKRNLVVVATGGRDYRDKDHVYRTLDKIHRLRNIRLLVEGGAFGADHHAQCWARERGVPFKTEYAKWNDISHPDAVVRTRKNGTQYNVLAGFWRNQKMMDDYNPDVVVVFPGGSGTADMRTRAGDRAWDAPL